MFTAQTWRRTWRAIATPWWNSTRRSLSRSRAASEEACTRLRLTRVAGQGAMWRGPSFELVRAVDPVSKATKFCQRCFGKIPKNGCNKLCTKTREVMKDGVQVSVRCGRRCHLGCKPVARYLDLDDRGHRCDAHMEVLEADIA